MKYIEDFHTIKKVALVFFANKLAIGYSPAEEPEVFDIDKKVIRWLKTYAGNIMVKNLSRISSYNVKGIDDTHGMQILGNQHLAIHKKIFSFDDPESGYWRTEAWNDYMLADLNIKYLIKTKQVNLYRDLILKSVPARINAINLSFDINKQKELNMHEKLESGMRALESTSEIKRFMKHRKTIHFSSPFSPFSTSDCRDFVTFIGEENFIHSEVKYLIGYCKRAANAVIYKDPAGYKLTKVPITFRKKTDEELLTTVISHGYIYGHLGTKYFTPIAQKNGAISSASKQKTRDEIANALSGVKQSEILHTYQFIIDNPQLIFVKSIDKHSALFMKKI